MITTIYVEQAVATHHRTQAILSRFPRARVIACDNYRQIFNLKAQNFRLQKKNPALILACKHGTLVQETPPAYGIGSPHNYYFSHMMNCVYDCRYCFLQGMYRSAHYVVFVNYEDFADAIAALSAQYAERALWFFSGYDCDSLALEPVTGFVEFMLPVFADLRNASLELRTKSTQIRTLRKLAPLDNCVVAYSMTPDPLARALEHKAPGTASCIESLTRLADHGWNIGLRFDPLIYCDDYAQRYLALFDTVFARLDPARVHSVTLGCFRMPKDYFRNAMRLHPDEKLFAGPIAEQAGGIFCYIPPYGEMMLDFCKQALSKYIPSEKLFLQH